MSRPARRPDEAAVSNVLGAVLMFGLLVLALTMIQVRFVPVWEEDREARHMQALADDLAQFKADLDRQAANDTAGTITGTFALRNEGGFRFFQSGRNLGASTQFVPAPDGTGVILTSVNPVQILRRNGEDLFGLDPTAWKTYTTEEKNNVTSVDYLMLRVTIASGSKCGGQNNYNATLNIYDAANALVGSVFTQVRDTGAGSDCEILVRTRDGATPTPNELHADTEQFMHNVGTTVYKYFDLLEPQRLLGPLLAQATGPFRLSFVQGTPALVASYQISYTDAGSGGVAGGSGVTEPDFATRQPSGRMVVDVHNQHYEDQVYVLEHGAVVLEQTTGSAMALPPSLSVTKGTTQAAVSWTFAGLGGDGMARGGDRVSALAAPSGQVQDVWFVASNATLMIPTSHPDAWRDYLDDLFVASGWDPDEYEITNTTSQVRLDLEGPFPNDPLRFDISLRFRVSHIDLALNPAG